MARIKTVFTDISKVAHLWAHQTQSEARNSGNFYFSGDTIYSYGSHFHIAKHVTNKKGEKAILLTTRTHSNTTSKHISVVRQAIPHGAKVIHCPYVGRREGNAQDWINQIEAQASSLPSARKPEKYLNAIDAIAHEVKAYYEYFGEKIPAALKVAMSITSKEQYSKYSVSKEKAIKKENDAKQRQLKLQHAEALTKWKAGEGQRLYVHDGFDYLRINNAKKRIETSQAVEIPIQSAKRLWPVIERKIASGGCIDCEGIKVLDWQVKEINKDYMVVGCHKIAYGEMRDIATALGLA